jgi:hypothetical protein
MSAPVSTGGFEANTVADKALEAASVLGLLVAVIGQWIFVVHISGGASWGL